MDKREEKRLLVKIAQMYYEEDMTQNAISKELGLYRTSVSNEIHPFMYTVSWNYSGEETWLQ